MAGTREKLIGLLGAGVSQKIAAEAAGVSESYVSQFLQEEGVREEIAQKRAGRVDQDIKADTTLENAEFRALNKMVSLLGTTMSLSEATRAYQVLNMAKRKAVGTPDTAGNQGVSVVLVLPKASETMLQVNAQNQVIDVNGRSIAPLPSSQLPKLAMALEHAKPAEVIVQPVQEVRSTVPATKDLGLPRKTELESKLPGRDFSQPPPLPAHLRDKPGMRMMNRYQERDELMAEMREKQEQRDKDKALNIMDDITTVINGVQVVI